MLRTAQMRLSDLHNDKLIPPFTRRQALRAMVGGVAALTVAHKASAAPVQAVQGIEVLPGQIGVLETDGDCYAYWASDAELEELRQPREFEVYSGSFTWTDQIGMHVSRWTGGTLHIDAGA
jgi:hypothetical protein